MAITLWSAPAAAQNPGDALWSEMGGQAPSRTKSKALMHELEARSEALVFEDAETKRPLPRVRVRLRYRDPKKRRISDFSALTNAQGVVMVPWSILSASSDEDFCLSARRSGYDELRQTITTRAGMFGVGGTGARYQLAKAGREGRKKEACALDIADKLARSRKSTIDVLVHFPFASHELTEKGRQQALEIGAALERVCKDVEGARFTIRGHTDSRGSADFNNRLSRRRAAAVREAFFQAQGKPACPVKIEGAGASQLKYADAKAEKDHAQNRRVEVLRTR